MAEMTAEQARAMLKAEEQERLEVCQREMNELLARHRCQLAAQCLITQDGRITANVILVPVAEG